MGVGCRPLLVPAKMTGVATPRLLPGPAAPGREVLPWLRKRRPFRKTSSCRVQSGGTGGVRAAGRDENRLGGSWMEARATLFWGDIGVPQRHLGSPGTHVPHPTSCVLSPPFLSPASCHPTHSNQAPAPPLSASSLPQMPTLMWKDDRETLGLPVVQRKRSCWSARGSSSGEGFWPGPSGRAPGAPASLLWKAVQVRPT